MAASVECRSRQIAFGFGLRDRRVLQITQMAVANRPVARWTDVRMGAAGIDFGHPMEPLEALGQMDRGSRNLDRDRTRSNTRPRHQKFSTPAHSA